MPKDPEKIVVTIAKDQAWDAIKNDKELMVLNIITGVTVKVVDPSLTLGEDLKDVV